MRSVRFSETFRDELERLLEQGELKFGTAIVEEKQDLVRLTITAHLAAYPNTGRLEHSHGLHVFAVRRTPFVLLYDFDETELRMHMVVHKSADRTRIDPAIVKW
jgi:mRNA-degrading endonuclease RelE of RelBE toxin-antitoxin system